MGRYGSSPMKCRHLAVGRDDCHSGHFEEEESPKRARLKGGSDFRRARSGANVYAPRLWASTHQDIYTKCSQTEVDW